VKSDARAADCAIACSRLAAKNGFSRIFRQGWEKADATARYSPSGLETGFYGHPCPQIAGYCTEYQENLIFLRKDSSRAICAIRRPRWGLTAFASLGWRSAVKCRSR